jgi:predicted ATP-grasp superfamily ATP-dependent carboligase
MPRGESMTARLVVTDAQERAVLAMVRCLAATGSRVTAVATTRTAPGLWSRGPERRLVAPDPRASVEGFLAALERIVADGTYDLLLAGADAALLAISGNRDRFAGRVQLGLPDHEVVLRSLDKDALVAAAARAGLAVPEGRVCQTPAEALAAAGELGYPALVKPLQTVVEVDGASRRWGSVVAADAAAVDAAIRRFGASIVQRRLQGPVISVGGVMAGGRLLAAAVSQYDRTWPVEGGNVSFSHTIAPTEGLLERVAALVEALGWSGLFEVELIWPADAGPAAIDFNPRAYGSLALAIAAGVPLPAIWCDWLLTGSAPASPVIAGTGVRYRWEDADARHLLWRARNGDGRRAARAILPRRGVTHAYFQLRDPLPGLIRPVYVARVARERQARP